MLFSMEPICFKDLHRRNTASARTIQGGSQTSNWAKHADSRLLTDLSTDSLPLATSRKDSARVRGSAGPGQLYKGPEPREFGCRYRVGIPSVFGRCDFRGSCGQLRPLERADRDQRIARNDKGPRRAQHRFVIGRAERIRTSDPLLPKQVRYQAALQPDRGWRGT
jgi:hypothetical protein